MDFDWYIRELDQSRASLPVVVFDGDDTLWATEALYDVARHRSAELVSAVGLDPRRFEDTQREIDIQNVERYGLSRVRFPTSSRQAYEVLAAERSVAPSESVAQAVYEASARVFDSPAPVAAHAEQTLRRLRDGYRVAVLTKGDPAVQRKRVDDSRLAALFDTVCIVEVKDAPVFAAVLEALDAQASASWSVGNSYGSDVDPAVAAGTRAIWIDARVWAHDRALSDRVFVGENPHVFVADDLDKVPAILDAAPARRPER